MHVKHLDGDGYDHDDIKRQVKWRLSVCYVA